MYPSFNARAAGLALGALPPIEAAAAAGFAGVDLLVRDLLDAGDEPAALRRRMDDLGLLGGAFPMPVRWKGDEATYRRDLADFPRQLDAASDLGLTRTATWVTPEIPLELAKGDEAEARRATVAFHLDRLGPIAEALAGRGMKLGLEAIGVASFRSGRTPALITRLGELGPILDPLASACAGAGVLLDTFHLYASGEPLEDALAWGVAAVAWVHVADLPPGASTDRSQIQDAERGLPGEHGAVDNRGVLARLQALGYDGPVTAEPLAVCRSLAGLDASRVAEAVSLSLRSVWPGIAGTR